MRDLPSVRLLLRLFLCACLTGAASGAQSLEDSDLEALGEALAAHGRARAEGFALEEPRQAVIEALDELHGESRTPPLGDPGALARALRLARDPDSFRQERGRVTTEVFQSGSFHGRGLEITYRLPKDYEPRDRDHPLILAAPDENEDPAEHVRSRWMASEIRDRAIVVSFAMPAESAAWSAVSLDGRPGGVAHVLTALRFATERFAVDPDRIFVAGQGRSVATALATGNYSPHRFAGVVARSGSLGATTPDNFMALPVYLAACGADAERFETAASELGAAACRRVADVDDLGVWKWMDANPRSTHPAELRVQTGNPFPTRVGWLRVAPSAPGAAAIARIDREKNRIEVTAEGVSHVTFYLNDALVDLGRELRVACNGREEVTQPVRSVTDTLDMLHDGTSDAGCVYVTRATFAVGGVPEQSADAGRERDPEFERRLDEAGADPAALRELAAWCASTGRERSARVAWRRLARWDADAIDARRALGYWPEGAHDFRSEEARARFLRSQDPARAEAKGHFLVKSVWLHADERSFANKGWTKDFATGQWLSRGEARRIGKGWVRQDLAWIEPEEADLADRGLWRLDGAWLDLDEANRRRASIDSMWTIPTREALLYTTVDRDVALRAAEHMGRAAEDLVRVFGAEPLLPLSVVLLRDEEQYDRFAIGDPDGRRPATHTERLHVVHTAFFAERWFPRVEGSPEFRGAGVSYWDTQVPHGDLYGVHAARLAFGLSFVDALDPSPKAVREALAKGAGPDYSAAYRAEKRLPAWLRWGGAVYAERYFRDEAAADGADPWWARAWSLENLRLAGGLRALDEVLALELDPEHSEEGRRWLLEVGLVVAFLVDGDCEPLRAAHEEFKRALAAGRLQSKHVEAMEEALRAHADELRAFAGG